MKNRDTELLVAVLRSAFERMAECDAECDGAPPNGGVEFACLAAYADLSIILAPALPILRDRMPQWDMKERVE